MGIIGITVPYWYTLVRLGTVRYRHVRLRNTARVQRRCSLLGTVR